MILERHEELLAFYKEKYTEDLGATIKAMNVREDEYCFPCKHLVSKKGGLP
jgi:hypothetical protein